jgi:hypothetical protein
MDARGCRAIGPPPPARRRFCASAGFVAKRAFTGRQINLADEGVGRLDVLDAGPGQLLGQAVLQGAEGALRSAPEPVEGAPRANKPGYARSPIAQAPRQLGSRRPKRPSRPFQECENNSCRARYRASRTAPCPRSSRSGRGSSRPSLRRIELAQTPSLPAAHHIAKLQHPESLPLLRPARCPLQKGHRATGQIRAAWPVTQCARYRQGREVAQSEPVA